VTWKTTNAINVSIKVDNQASQIYGPNSPLPSGQSISFVCATAPHTFYIVANGNGGLQSPQQVKVVAKA
jgi:hypothetical protein